MQKRYQREIEEILKQAGEDGPPAPRDQKPENETIWRLIWLYVKQSLGGKGLSISPGRIMLIAVSLLLSALLIRAFIPGAVAYLAWAGLLLFIVGYAMFFVKPPKLEKRWHQEVIEEEGGDSWWSKFRRKRK